MLIAREKMAKPVPTRDNSSAFLWFVQMFQLK